MNDFFLRGFCQKCDAILEAQLADKPKQKAMGYWIVKYFSTTEQKGVICTGNGREIHSPVWFLNAKQIKIISKSNKYIKWVEDYGSVWNPIEDGLYLFEILLEMEPFLVAQILKESEKK